MTEHQLCAKIVARLRTMPPDCWHIKNQGSLYQRHGIPDLLIVSRGRVLAVELKHPGEAPTPTVLQRRELEHLEAAGAITACVNTEANFWALFTATFPWLVLPAAPRVRGRAPSAPAAPLPRQRRTA